MTGPAVATAATAPLGSGFWSAISTAAKRWVSSSSILAIAVGFGTTGLVRLAHGYRPFPSIDDFTYVPLAMSRLDPALYSRDMLIQETPLHVPLLPPLVAVFEATVGVSTGFWLLTMVLSVLTLAALLRLQQAIGGSGGLFPLAAVVACAGQVDGLGRGDYDGVFGDAFHLQWMALCALLWCYDALVREQRWRAALLLLVGFCSHPVVGAHGVVVAACGVLAGARRTTRTARLAPWLAALAVLVLAGAAAWLALARPTADSVAQLSAGARGILFRLPQEFEFNPLQGLLFLVVALVGISGAVRLLRTAPRKVPISIFLGLVAGQLALLGAAAALYEARSIAAWSRFTLLPFQLSLTRTTPLLLALGAIAGIAALEAEWWGVSKPETLGPRLAGRIFWLCVGAAGVSLAVFQVQWSWPIGLAVLLALLTGPAAQRPAAIRWIAGIWIVVGVGSFAGFIWTSQRDASLPADQQQLLAWAREDTPADALFIVPPGLQEFRYYSRRAVFVDFKTVTPGDPRLVALWRERLETECVPDQLALMARGWEGIDEWDRTYATRNTPNRIERLLSETGADFWVCDDRALQTPPFVEPPSVRAPGLDLVFQNERYRVYRRRGGGNSGESTR